MTLHIVKQHKHLEHLFFFGKHRSNKDSMREWPLLCAISTVEVPSSSTCSTFALASHNDWTISRKPFLWSSVAVGGWQGSTGSTYWRTRTLKIFRGMMHFERLVQTSQASKYCPAKNLGSYKEWRRAIFSSKIEVRVGFPLKRLSLSWKWLEEQEQNQRNDEALVSEQSAVELFNGDRYDALTHFETTHEWSQIAGCCLDAHHLSLSTESCDE